jgi:uncharacterized linocin/CFP29 family protein
MVDILRRAQAPISDEAWREIDEEATRTLKNYLSGRAVVDFKGPLGWNYGGVDLGRLEVSGETAKDGVGWGIRKVQPLVEVRAAFFLSQMELDSISRGSADADLGPVAETAKKIAMFEENALYHGFSKGGIQGILKAAKHKPISLPKEAKGLPDAVSTAVKALRMESIDGPYALVLAPDVFQLLNRSAQPGYPVRKIIEELIQGEVLAAPALKGGLLLSTRGGDFELTVGQDISIGYTGHDRDKVELYLTESFTFRVLEPAAAVELKASSR